MSDAVCVWPSATCLKLQVIHSLWLPLLDLACNDKLHSKASIYQHRAQGQARKHSKAPQDPPVPVFTHQLPAKHNH